MTVYKNMIILFERAINAAFPEHTHTPIMTQSHTLYAETGLSTQTGPNETI